MITNTKGENSKTIGGGKKSYGGLVYKCDTKYL